MPQTLNGGLDKVALELDIWTNHDGPVAVLSIENSDTRW